MLRTVPLSIIRSFSLNIHIIQVTITACEQDQDGTAVPSWSCSQDVSKLLWHTPLLCVQWKTPDDGHRNCPKHVEFYSNNKFEKLVHLVGFIIRIYHDARSPERQICKPISIKIYQYYSRVGNKCRPVLSIPHSTEHNDLMNTQK